MTLRLWVAVAAGLLAASGSTAASAQAGAAIQTPPEAGMTKGEAMRIFSEAVLLECLGSRERGIKVADVAAGSPIAFQPAPEIDRKWAHPASAETPVWTNQRLGGLLSVSEPSADRCDVDAMQLPVDEAFKRVVGTARALHPDFVDVPIKPGYNPIAYELRRDQDGVRYTIHMEGSEPGGLEHPGRMLQGHAFRFSLLRAWVSRAPAPASR